MIIILSLVLNINCLFGSMKRTNHNFKCFFDNDMSTKEYFEQHVYLSTHTFYGSQYEYSTKILYNDLNQRIY